MTRLRIQACARLVVWLASIGMMLAGLALFGFLEPVAEVEGADLAPLFGSQPTWLLDGVAELVTVTVTLLALATFLTGLWTLVSAIGTVPLPRVWHHSLGRHPPVRASGRGLSQLADALGLTPKKTDA